jgi:hypothetical protein
MLINESLQQSNSNKCSYGLGSNQPQTAVDCLKDTSNANVACCFVETYDSKNNTFNFCDSRLKTAIGNDDVLKNTLLAYGLNLKNNTCTVPAGVTLPAYNASAINGTINYNKCSPSLGSNQPLKANDCLQDNTNPLIACCFIESKSGNNNFNFCDPRLKSTIGNDDYLKAVLQSYGLEFKGNTCAANSSGFVRTSLMFILACVLAFIL